MRSIFTSITALLLSMAILLLGNGLLGTFLPVRASLEAFSPIQVGLMGSGYFVGFVAGCLYGPHVVQRAGHIRSFAALAALASVGPLVHALAVDPAVWFVLRALTGFALAGLYLVIESWLNERSPNELRGAVLSAYTVTNLTALMVGQMLLNTAPPDAPDLFLLTSILMSLALIPVALTKAIQPPPIEHTDVAIRRVYKVSPVGFIGCLVVGLVNGTFWSIAPVFASDMGMNVKGVSVFMAIAILGGALAQWPLGRASDKVDRRLVILAACAFGATICVLLALAQPLGELFGLSSITPLLLAGGFLFGAVAFPLYPLCIAHANDYVDPSDFVAASSGLLLIFGVGAVVGPFGASVLVEWFGPGATFGFNAFVYVVFIGFVAYRMTRRSAIQPEERESFVAMPLPRGSSGIFEIDPRSDEEDTYRDEWASKEGSAEAGGAPSGAGAGAGPGAEAQSKGSS